MVILPPRLPSSAFARLSAAVPANSSSVTLPPPDGAVSLPPPVVWACSPPSPPQAASPNATARAAEATRALSGDRGIDEFLSSGVERGEIRKVMAGAGRAHPAGRQIGRAHV